MKLVEQHIIKKSDPRYAAIDAAAFASKNLYNQVTYQFRQAFIHEGKYLSYAQVFPRVKQLDCYQALPRKVSNSILILIDKKLDQITTKRNRRVNAYLHTASRRIVNLLADEGIGTVVIGKNPFWKQEVKMGRKNNQQFVQIPHARFIEMVTYKAQLVGIQVVIGEESYTSKASFLDRDPIPMYDPKRTEKPSFSGKREKRGLYRASNGRRIHADINGSYNILCKAFPNSFGQGIAGPAVAPCRLVGKRREDMGSSVPTSRLNE
jgi:IS605 OrfB family transposase